MPSTSGYGWGCANPLCAGKPLNPLVCIACLSCGYRAGTNFQNFTAEQASKTADGKDKNPKK